MSVNTTIYHHALAQHELQYFLVEHILTVVEHVFEHVDVAHWGPKKTFDSAIVRESLIKVFRLCEQQQWAKGVRVAVKFVPRKGAAGVPLRLCSWFRVVGRMRRWR
jgi:hypothetical protein